MSTLRTAGCLGTLVAALFLHGTAYAQGDAQKAATAQSLFEEANKAMDAKNYAVACPKLERVVDLIPEGVGAKMSLAECYEGSGRLASAFGMYVATEGAAVRANQPDRVAKARERMDALKPRLAYLTLDVPDDAKKTPGFAMKKDGTDISPAEFGAPIALDKGDHLITVTATGKAGWEKRFTINDGERLSIKVETGPSGENTIKDTGPKDGGAGTPVGPTAQTHKNFFSPLRIAGLGIGVVGVVGAAIGIGLGFHAKGLYDDSNDTGGCNADTNVCTSQTGVDARNQALTFGNAATGLVVAGGVLAAGGIIMFAVAPSEDVKVGVAPGYVSVTTSF